LSQVFDMPIVVSTHPRTRKRLDEMPDIKLPETIQFLKPFGFFDYIKLQTKAFCVISDSGTITEESSLLGFPAVTIREMHERPEGFDAGTLIMSGLGKDSTEKAIKVIRSQKFDQANPDHRFADQFGRVEDYESSFPSRQILRIVLSYTDYVNRVVWRKN
jgi:UDP-N-acetylglucosamine 2-epimerase (non-hydrolysing)